MRLSIHILLGPFIFFMFSFPPPENSGLTCGRVSPVSYVFLETHLTVLTHYPPRAPVLPGVPVTAFTGSHAGGDALQLIQAFWEARGTSPSVSKPVSTQASGVIARCSPPSHQRVAV